MRISGISTPYLRITPKGFIFNATCMQLMPDVGYVQFMQNFKHGRLYAIECGVSDEDNAPWRSHCSSREVRAKHVKWIKFYNLICDEMNWIHGNEYTLLAVLKEFDGKRGIFFDLNDNKEYSPFWNIKLSDLQPVDVGDDSISYI